MRYKNESKEKRNGVIYTPTEMADYHHSCRKKGCL